jgi:formylglycine-generating enzyme required for sulfatase activity
VSYDEAVLLAAWRGCRLPTEQELEWAGRGSTARVRPPGLAAGQPLSGPNWSSLHGVRDVVEDRIDTPGGPLFGLYGNAGELTLFRFRPYSRNVGSLPYSSSWYGQVVRSGLTGNCFGSPELLGYVRRVSMPRDVKNPLVGFRCARSISPCVPSRSITANRKEHP